MPYYVITMFDDPSIAKRLGRSAVESGLAACVSIINGVKSIYRWKDNIEESQEVLCLFKTADDTMRDLEEFIKKEHPYELPEIVSIRMDRISDEYEKWLIDSCKSKQ